MKKLLYLLGCIMINHITAAQYTFVEYDPSYKQRMIELAFQEKEKLFIGYSVTSRLPEFMKKAHIQQMDQENQKLMESNCDNPIVRKLLVLDNDRLAGYVIYMKMREASLESIEKAYQKNLETMPESTRSQIPPFNPSAYQGTMPDLKKTDAECQEFIKIDAIVVSTDMRRKGYGEALLRATLDDSKKRWPAVTTIELTVNKDNPAAIALYEKLGFTRPATPSIMMNNMMGSVTYEKSLVSSKL
jgi:ribosomal protein S18 acetylase RimI-like enzyme